MIQLRTMLTVADNTGGKQAQMIGVPMRGHKKKAQVGDIITAVIKTATPFGMVKKGEVVRAVVVRTRKEKRRSDGSYVRFDDNAVVIIAGKDREIKDPKGTRIFGPIAKELKEKGFAKIASLAEEIY